ncbi:MAG: 3-hydroxybutyryl-CoA dehydrogenase [Deltaproteobacteria bacterium]|nr:3-hydroxybutyryl-CoA dehydrogenase [Deltaproteobacteria bacterium]
MEFKTIGVLGTGQMGAGIAQVAAEAGLRVLMADINREIAEKGKAGIARLLGKAVEKGKLDAARREAVLARLEPVDSVAAFQNVDLAIEAATEQIELKLKLFRSMDEACPARAVLATNTSSISITLIAAATKRPARVIGMHFMNPVPVMKLVELIRALQTDDETYDAVKALAEKMGKTCITAKDAPGFIVNRILLPMLNEACYALMEGLGTPEDIDNGIKLGLNHPMGPLALADLIGLDTCLAIAEVLHKGLGDDKYRPCPLLRKYVEAGWLGRKVRRGFYKYEG